jgi:hypothetical protein
MGNAGVQPRYPIRRVSIRQTETPQLIAEGLTFVIVDKKEKVQLREGGLGGVVLISRLYRDLTNYARRSEFIPSTLSGYSLYLSISVKISSLFNLSTFFSISFGIPASCVTGLYSGGYCDNTQTSIIFNNL